MVVNKHVGKADYLKSNNRVGPNKNVMAGKNLKN